MTARSATPWLIAGAAFALAITQPPSDSDMWWHLASGKWMVEHRELLDHEVFSSTITGERYTVGEWLGQIVLYLAYAAGGWGGLVLLRGALVAIAAFFLTRAALRTGAPLRFAVPVVALAISFSAIVWTERPHLFTLAFVPLTLDLLLAARDGHVRRLVLVPPLLLLWTDLHGGYALGLALVGIFALDALLRRRHVAPFFAAAVLGGIATLLDPGALGLAGALGHVAAPPRFIVEEAPPDVRTPAGAVFAIVVLLTAVVAIRVRATLFDVLLLAPVLLLALSAQRHMPYFLFVAAPFLSRAIPRAVRARESIRPLPRALLPGTAVGVGVAAILALATLPTAPDEHAFPSGALAPLASTRPQLLNEDDWGGYLIWMAPERPVFIDGRLFPFLPDVFDDFQRVIEAPAGYAGILARHDVWTVLLRPERPLVRALAADGWTTVARDDGWVLLARP